MEANLWNFLVKYRESTDNYNFTSQLQSYLGKFKLERAQLEEFWKLYCDGLQKKGKEFISGLAEKPYDHQPLLIDIDLSIKYEEGIDITQKLYDMSEIKIFLTIVQRVIKESIKDWKAIKCSCIFLEKETPYVDNMKIKGGFHVHFPRLWLRTCDIDLHIIPKIKQYIETEYPNLFKKIPENSSTLVDEKITKKFWLLYGSRKAINKGSYLLSKVFDVACKETTLLNIFKGYSLYNAMGDEIKLDSEETIIYNLPRLLSTHPLEKTITYMKTNLECVVKQSMNTAKDRTIKRETLNVSEAVKIASELLELISSSRADEYNSWMEFGWILFCIGDGCQEALDLWISFSMKTSKGNYDETKCVYEWQRMANTSSYSIGTLRYYASVDNPSAYEQWKKKRASSRIPSNLQVAHNDLAKMLYDCYGSVYVCASAEKSSTWFEYSNHKWIRIEKGLNLRKKISEELVNRFQDETRKIYSEVSDTGDDSAVQSKIKVINTIIKNLKSAPFKNSVMVECQEVFHDQDFMKKLDADTHIIGFTNGVLDLRQLRFREGKPEDYISLCTGYEYKDFSEDDPSIIEVKDFFIKIFPDPSLRRYFLEYCAYLLRGGNINKIFLDMAGDGDNGKSVTVELIQQTLGSYSIKLPTSLITGKRTQSSSATPELARIHGVRFAALQEPDSKDVINVGMLKELSGNDGITVRGLYQEQKDVTPMLKIALICNNLPRLSDTDSQAHWNRIRVLRFESRFPKDPNDVPKTYEEQLEKKIFPRNPNFNDNLPKMKQAFMWILFQIYKELDKNGPSEEPVKISEATETYKRNNDIYLQFITEHITINHDNKNISMSLNEIFSLFVHWFRESYPSIKCPNKTDLKEDLLKRWGPYNEEMKWIGIKIKTLSDHINDGNALVLNMDDIDNSDLKLEQKEQKEYKVSEKNVLKIESKNIFFKPSVNISSNDFEDDMQDEDMVVKPLLYTRKNRQKSASISVQ